jgi:hypothetical protein
VLSVELDGAKGIVVCDRCDRVGGLISGFCGIFEGRGHDNGLVDGKIVVWILAILHDVHPVINLNLIDCGHHSWGVEREVVKGGVAGCYVNVFVFSGLNDLNNVVVARLLQLEVNTQEFRGDAGVGISVGFNKAFFVVEIVIAPIV